MFTYVERQKMRDKELKVEYEPTEKLVSYKNNAKIHTGEQVDQIKRSIEEFGFNDPIAVWTNPDGKSEIVEGHGRLLAAQELGIAEVPVIHLDTLTDEQRRAYTHVHNQLTMNTGWDFETLELDLAELDFDFGKFGFTGVSDFMDMPGDEYIDMDIDGNGERETSVNSFRIDGKKYPITKAEAAALIEALNDYVERVGTAFGFFGELLWK